jgi:hypothetical protein
MKLMSTFLVSNDFRHMLAKVTMHIQHITNIAIRLHKKTEVLRPLHPTKFNKKHVLLILEHICTNQSTINLKNVIHYIKISN